MKNPRVSRRKEILKIRAATAAAAESLQLCLTLCNPIDGSPPDSPIPGILQARILEWGAIAFSDLSAKCELNLPAPSIAPQDVLHLVSVLAKPSKYFIFHIYFSAC